MVWKYITFNFSKIDHFNKSKFSLRNKYIVWFLFLFCQSKSSLCSLHIIKNQQGTIIVNSVISDWNQWYLNLEKKPPIQDFSNLFKNLYFQVEEKFSNIDFNFLPVCLSLTFAINFYAFCKKERKLQNSLLQRHMKFESMWKNFSNLVVFLKLITFLKKVSAGFERKITQNS